MKNILSTALISLAVLAAAHTVQAADVKGNVKTDVKTGVILQKNTGIANKNELAIGSITGGKTTVGGSFTSKVSSGAIIQTNTGIANKNEISLGSVSD